MWPWGHAAVGYLAYAGWCRLAGDRQPTAVPAMAVVFGAVLPDLIDKPLAWWLNVLPTGRALGHSLLFVLPVVGMLWLVLDRRHSGVVAALGGGWLTHLVADGVGAEPAYLGYLLWPVTTTPPYPTEQSFAAHFTSVVLNPFFILQLVLALVALLVWHRDGRPGISAVRKRLRLLWGSTVD